MTTHISPSGARAPSPVTGSASRVGRAIADLSRALSMWRIWSFRAYEQLISRYRRSLLGPFWLAASMAATAISLSIVFGALFRQPIKEVLPFITGGILAWNMLAMPLSEAPEIFVASGGIIRNHAYPFMYYVIEAALKNFIQFAHNLVVFFVFEIAVGAFTVPNYQILPALMLVFLCNLVWSTVSALVASRFRDIRFMFPYVAQVLFFMTPIFWRVDSLPPAKRIVGEWNPLFYMVRLIREPLLGRSPSLHDWAVVGGIALVGTIIWLATFSAFRRRIPFWV